MTQPREGLANAGKDVGRIVAIFDVGGVNNSPNEQPLRVSDDMAFAVTTSFRMTTVMAIFDRMSLDRKWLAPEVS